MLLDDSCAVGLQSVFHIRWIMNKPLQQKRLWPIWAVPLVVCPSLAGMSSTRGRGGTGEQQKSLWCRNFPKKIKIWDVFFFFLSHIFSCSKNFLSSFHVSSVWISAVSPKLAVRNPAPLFVTCQTCVKSAEHTVRVNTTLLLQYTQQLYLPSGTWSHLPCLHTGSPIAWICVRCFNHILSFGASSWISQW